MDIKPIKSKADHKAALKAVESPRRPRRVRLKATVWTCW